MNWTYALTENQELRLFIVYLCKILSKAEIDCYIVLKVLLTT